MVDRREFHITAKTPHTDLTNGWGSLNYYKAREKIADDMIANGRELTDEVSWRDVLDSLEGFHQGRTYSGRAALIHSVARSIGTVADHMGWDMHSPEVVYMGGYHFAWALGQKLDRLNLWQEEAQQGKKDFIDERSRVTALQRNEQEIGTLGTFRSKLNGALTEYTEQYLPKGEDYLEILRALIYFPSERIGSQRFDIYDALKRGDVATAHTIVKATAQ